MAGRWLWKMLVECGNSILTLRFGMGFGNYFTLEKSPTVFDQHILVFASDGQVQYALVGNILEEVLKAMNVGGEVILDVGLPNADQR